MSIETTKTMEEEIADNLFARILEKGDVEEFNNGLEPYFKKNSVAENSVLGILKPKLERTIRLLNKKYQVLGDYMILWPALESPKLGWTKETFVQWAAERLAKALSEQDREKQYKQRVTASSEITIAYMKAFDEDSSKENRTKFRADLKSEIKEARKKANFVNEIPLV